MSAGIAASPAALDALPVGATAAPSPSHQQQSVPSSSHLPSHSPQPLPPAASPRPSSPSTLLEPGVQSIAPSTSPAEAGPSGTRSSPSHSASGRISPSHTDTNPHHPNSSSAVNLTPDVSSIPPELTEEHAHLLASLAAGHGFDLTAHTLPQHTSGHFVKQEAEYPVNAFDHTTDPSFQHTQADVFSDGAIEEDVDDEEEDMHMDPGPQGPIQAYAKIDFPGFSIYVQTLRVTIGRRPAHLARRQDRVMPRSIQDNRSPAAQGDVDIDLGRVKAISRLHAIIYYHAGPFYPQTSDDQTAAAMNFAAYCREPTQPLRDLFVIQILGRHGAMIDDVWIRQGGIVQLGKR